MVPKFRTWLVAEKKMSYDTPVSTDKTYSSVHYVWVNGSEGWSWSYLCSAYVVMRRSKEKDINKNRIYEGDIVQTANGRIGVVKIDYGRFLLYDEKARKSIRKREWSKCEILGNIYENPELLEADNANS
jgi:hypothetical protein